MRYILFKARSVHWIWTEDNIFRKIQEWISTIWDFYRNIPDIWVYLKKICRIAFINKVIKFNRRRCLRHDPVNHRSLPPPFAFEYETIKGIFQNYWVNKKRRITYIIKAIKNLIYRHYNPAANRSCSGIIIPAASDLGGIFLYIWNIYRNIPRLLR